MKCEECGHDLTDGRCDACGKKRDNRYDRTRKSPNPHTLLGITHADIHQGHIITAGQEIAMSWGGAL